MKRQWKRIAVGAVIAATATVALAAGGSLDPAFGSAGIVWIDAGIEGAFLRDLAVQTDGKILAAGEYETGQVNEANQAISDWVIRRLDATGTADPGFGTGGLVRVSGAGYLDKPWDIALDSSGRAVVVGQLSVRTVTGSGKKQTVSFPRIATLVRLTANGALDPTFGAGGVVKAAVPGAKESFGEGLAIQPDGRVVIAGHASFVGTTRIDPFVARFLADGQVDTAFGTSGFTVDKRAATKTTLVRAVALQSTGQIVVAQEQGPGAGWVVTRFSASGAIDSGFGRIAAPDSFVRGLSIDRFDRIVATGYKANSGAYEIRIARYLADGSADASFGVGGVATVHVYSRQQASSDPAFQPDDKIVFSAQVAAVSPGPWLGTTVRLNDDGSLDSGYGAGGLAAPIALGAQSTFANGLALAPDGGILLAGGLSPSDAWYVARYTPN